MQKILVLATVAVLGGTTLVAAQPAPGTPPGGGPGAGPEAGAGEMGRMRPSGPMGEGRMGEGRMGEGRMGEMREMMMRRGRMRGPEGAHFTFERDGAVIDLRCADNETTRACVDAAAVLLEKLAPAAAR